MHLESALQPLLLELARAELARDAHTTPKVSPEREELDKLQAELKRTRDAAGSAQLAVDDMENEILRIQEDERKLKARERDDKAQLKTEANIERRKDLEHDLYATKSRIADLMYELKEAHNEIHALRNNRDVHGAQVDELARKVEMAKRAAEAADAAPGTPDPAERVEELRAQLPAEALKAYDECKKEADAGAALFNGRSCGACFIVLPGPDRSTINLAPADEVPPCPNCGTFLVRKVA